MNNASQLFAEFTPVSKADWLAKIDKDIKGKPLADLQFQLDHLDIDPFPHQDDLKELPEPFPGYGNDWEIGEDLDAKDVLAANRQALHSLENGVQAPRFILGENLGDHRMDSLLEKIDLDMVSIHFLEKNKNAQPGHLLHHFYHTAKAMRKDASRLQGSVNWSHPEAVVLEDAVELLEFTQAKLPRFKVLTVNAPASSEEGSVIQQLAQTIQMAEDWISRLNDKGFSPEAVNSFLQFSVSIGTNYFVEISKIRAFRLLWANVLKAWGVKDAALPPIEAHIIPSSHTDGTHTYLIQATTQAMAAVLAGANRVTLSVPDAQGGTDFSRRIFRNIQHILKMESHLDRVADPAAGSFFIENLTQKMAEAAWGEFQAAGK